MYDQDAIGVFLTPFPALLTASSPNDRRTSWNETSLERPTTQDKASSRCRGLPLGVGVVYHFEGPACTFWKGHEETFTSGLELQVRL